MSNEGVTLLWRAVLVLFLIVAGAMVRTFIGPSRPRGYGMLAGMAFGILVGHVMLKWDESAALAVLGMVGGWSIAWLFARRIPRQLIRQHMPPVRGRPNAL